jgi:hypothetical protein
MKENENGEGEREGIHTDLLEMLSNPGIVIAKPSMAVLPNLPCLGEETIYGRFPYNLLGGKGNYGEIILSEKGQTLGREGDLWREAYDSVVLALKEADDVEPVEDWSGNILENVLIGVAGRYIPFNRELIIEDGFDRVYTTQKVKLGSKAPEDRFYLLDLLGNNIRRKDVTDITDENAIKYPEMKIRLCILGEDNARKILSCIEDMIKNGGWSNLIEALLRAQLSGEFPGIDNMSQEQLLAGVEGIPDGKQLNLKVMNYLGDN